MQMGSMRRIRGCCHPLPCCLLLLDHLQVAGQCAYMFSILHPSPQLQFATNQCHVRAFEQREVHAHRANMICCNVLKRLGFHGSDVRVRTILDKQGGVTMQVVAEQQALRMHRRQLQQGSLLIPQRAQAPMHFLR